MVLKTITVNSGGYNFSGAASAEILMDGQEIGFGTYKIGMNVAVFDENTGLVISTQNFNTTVKPKDDLFADYIDSLPTGRIVAIAVYGNCIPADGGLSDRAIAACKSVGSAQIELVQPNYAWSLIGIKNQPGTGSESFTWPNASASKVVDIPSPGPAPGTPKKLELKQIVWLRNLDSAFGNSGVAIENGTALVGADLNYLYDPARDNAGSVYVLNLDYDQWQPQQQLIAGDLLASDNFGHSVAISGNTAIIGANLKDGFNAYANTDAGAAYIFEFEGDKWQEKQKFEPLDLGKGDNFGWTVDISGNLAIAGAYLAERWRTNTNAGAAYIFQLKNEEWKQIQLLQPQDLIASDYFGYSVAISGNVAIVGAYMAEAPSQANAGAAYIFALENDKWVQKQKLQPETLKANDYFGFSVAISGKEVIVGAYMSEEDGVINGGAAYVFEFDEDSEEWKQKQKLKPREQLTANEYFGWSVGISGDMAVVGAQRSDGVGKANAGAVYVFQKDSNGLWQPKQKEQPADLLANDNFGNSVDIDGSQVIVGSTKHFVAIYDVVVETEFQTENVTPT
ncbi:hypothetical protein BJP34_16010 [Moorena producens PAL-8-15-08-1]|uniref:ILEI/PANDER domain-containing protein n=1 Tax=Moorena producens PAL-8-15-08-1 TaxID=1458985 RepID=A0A1D8TT03_9CYAN|nr:interleukin-like EMT inducer domain-containing protein [Moorena producens]AOX00747.1 hypothetical protein BJP34_16010 [Moorena producens PAL-8-15-08-1]